MDTNNLKEVGVGAGKEDNPKDPKDTGCKDNKGKKKKYHGRRRDKFPPKDPKDERPNDVSWYKNEPILAEQASKVQTYHTNGLDYSLIDNPISKQPDDRYPEHFGSKDGAVAAIQYCILPGHSLTSADPFNHCRINFFNMVRGKYTSTVPFQANDIGCYFLAVGNVLAAIAEAKRALVTVNVNDASYANASQLMLNAAANMHNKGSVNLIAERAAYAANTFKLNLQIARLSTLCLPSNVPFLKRCAWLSSRYYYDDASERRGNLYFYTLKYRFKWSSEIPTHDKPTLKASGLTRVTAWDTASSINKMIDAISEAIDALTYDDNVRQISGWFRQYFRDSTLAETYANFEPAKAVISKEIREQFSNARFLGSNANISEIPQDISRQGLYCPLTGKLPTLVNASPSYGGWLFNFETQPTQDDVLTASRLTPVFKITDTTARSGYWVTDVIVPVNLVFVYSNDGTPASTSYLEYSNDISLGVTKDVSGASPMYKFDENSFETLKRALEFGTLAGFFNMRPFMRIELQNGSSTSFYRTQMYGKHFNFVIQSGSLENMHRVAIYSQFGVPHSEVAMTISK